MIYEHDLKVIYAYAIVIVGTIKSNMKSHEHLSKISERGGDEYRQHVEDKLSAIETRDHGNKNHEAFGDIEQPEAAELLDFIARCNMDAHAELGNLASNDEVWHRSMRIASHQISRSEENGIDSAVTKEMMKGLFAMGLLSSQLDSLSSAHEEGSCPAAVSDLIANGSSYIRELAGEAINESKDSGLVGLVETKDRDGVVGIPIGSQVAQVLYAQNKLRGEEQQTAITIDAQRNRPDQNDRNLMALMDRQEDRTHKVHADRQHSLSAAIDLVNDDDELQGKLILQSGNYSNQTANKYIRMLREKADYTALLDGQNPAYARDLVMREVSEIPADRLQSMYFSPKDKEGGALRYLLRQGVDIPGVSGVARTNNKIIEKAYGKKCYHLANDERALSDPIVREKLETPAGYLSFAINVEQPTDTSDYAEFTQALRDNTDIFLRKLGLPDSISYSLQRALNEKTMKKDENGFSAQWEDRCVDAVNLHNQLVSIMMTIEKIGVENVAKLSEVCGIINIQNYTPEQLERMIQFADGDQETLTMLREGDVTALLIDATGDHNNAMSSTAQVFEKPSGRTLFFEVNQPSDFYRHMARLRKAGIAPSTLAIGAHGSPGAMHFSDSDGKFILTNADIDEQRENYQRMGAPRVVVQESAGLSRLARDYMQPSRGIDDDDSQIGQVNIILKSCSQAVKRPVRRVEYGIGTERNESMAETLSQKMGANVNVFAADAAVSLRRGQDSRSLQYFEDNKQTDALRHTTDEQGNVVITRQKTIPLYQEASTEQEIA